MAFTNDWFEITGIKNFEQHLYQFKDCLVSFLEIGTYEGRAAVWLLNNILTHHDSCLTVIDTFGGSIEHSKKQTKNLLRKFLENTMPYKEKIRIKKGFSYKELRKFKPMPLFDFIYIDGSHYASDVLEDAVLAFRLLKPKGIMIFDDYTFWAFLEADQKLLPGLAIEAFLNVFQGQYDLLDKNTQVVIQKR